MPFSLLVLGGAHMDRRGRIFDETIPGASNPGAFFEEPGGGAFNAARNLARLGNEVTMIAPRGGDAAGEAVEAAAERAGVDYRPVTYLDRTTPSYTAIIDSKGDLVIALADMALYKAFHPRRLIVRATREAIMAADGLLTDANLPDVTLAQLAQFAALLGKPLFAIAISPVKVKSFRACLPALSMLFMNQAEAASLCGERPDHPEGWIALLRETGLSGACVTGGSGPIVAFLGDDEAVVTPPPAREIGDVTGAGDGLASGVIHGLMQGKSLEESLRIGVAVAHITLASPFAHAPDLSTTRLEAMLAEHADSATPLVTAKDMPE